MTPDVPEVMAELAAILLRNASPDAPAAERAGTLTLTAMLLGIAAEVWDGAAAQLVEENQTLRRLLDLPGADADLRLSALQAENRRLRAALIAAHSAAEAAGDAPREAAIWAELVASTERRRIASSPV